MRLDEVYWLNQHPNNGKALLFHRSGIYIVQQTGIKIVKNGINMKIGTIFKNIMCAALCIFQLSSSIFKMLYSTRTSIGHEFCIYRVKPRSTGPFTVSKTCCFSLILTAAYMPCMSSIEVKRGFFGSPSTQIMGKHCYSTDTAYIWSSRQV